MSKLRVNCDTATEQNNGVTVLLRSRLPGAPETRHSFEQAALSISKASSRSRVTRLAMWVVRSCSRLMCMLCDNPRARKGLMVYWSAGYFARTLDLSLKV